MFVLVRPAYLKMFSTDHLYFLCFTFLPVSSEWRFTPTKLPQHHYRHERYGQKSGFFGTDNVSILKHINGNQVKWIVSCDHHRFRSDGNSLLLHFFDVTECEISTDLSSCTTCSSGTDNELLVRVVKLSDCFFWQTEEVLENFHIHFKVYVSSKYLMATGNQRYMKILTNQFASNEEQPIFSDLEGIRLNVISSYNSSSSQWDVIISKQIVKQSPFFVVSALQNDVLFGCTIASTTVFSKYATTSDANFFRIISEGVDNSRTFLRGVNVIHGKLRYHPCFPSRGLLVTENGLFYTVDDFENTLKLTIQHTKAEMNEFGSEVTDINVGLCSVYIILNGTMFVATCDDLLFKIVEVDVEEPLLGIESSPVCICKNQERNTNAWESSLVVAWSSKKIFRAKERIFDSQQAKSWDVFKLPREFNEYSIVEVRLPTDPELLWILARSQSTSNLLECSILQRVLSCSELTVMQQFLNDVVDWSFVSSAYPSALIWSRRSLRYSFDQDELRGFYSEVSSIKRVFFSVKHTKWIVQDEENLLYFGSGKSTRLVQLRRVDLVGSTSFTYKFREIDDKVIRILWQGDTITYEIYPLYEELYNAFSLLSEAENCGFVNFRSSTGSKTGNVVVLDAIGEKVAIKYELITSSEKEIRFRIRTNFLDLAMLTNTSSSVKTIRQPNNVMLRRQTYETSLTGTCMENGSSCNRGLAMFELSLVGQNGLPVCSKFNSEVLFVNVTCQEGMHIKVRANAFVETSSLNASSWPGGKAGCAYDYEGSGATSRSSICSYTLDYPYIFFPIVELYHNERFVRVIEESVEMTEVNGRTGFGFVNYNLILKECYLCSGFRAQNSSSVLLLEIAKKVCPCRLDKFAANRWIGNISLRSVGEPTDRRGPNIVIFRLTVLGPSYCNLTALMRILVLPLRELDYDPWGSNILWGFAISTLLLLVFSYWIYRRDVLKVKRA